MWIFWTLELNSLMKYGVWRPRRFQILPAEEFYWENPGKFSIKPDCPNLMRGWASTYFVYLSNCESNRLSSWWVMSISPRSMSSTSLISLFVRLCNQPEWLLEATPQLLFSLDRLKQRLKIAFSKPIGSFHTGWGHPWLPFDKFPKERGLIE